MTQTETSDPLAVYVRDFNKRRVLVLGDAMLDEVSPRRVQQDFS